MLRHIFLITFRNLMRNKSFSFINIFGLSIGLACCLLIYSYVRFEFSYNKTIPDYQSIYQVLNDSSNNKSQIDHRIAYELMETQSSVMAATSFLNVEGHLQYGDRFFQGRLLLTDSSFFRVFNFPFTYGNTQTAFGPDKIIINEKMANEIFGRTNVIGEYIMLGRNTEFRISAVIKNIPSNSSLQFDYIIYHNNDIVTVNYCDDGGCIYPKTVFIRLQPGTHPSQIDKKVASHFSTDYPNKMAFQPLENLYLFDNYNVTGLEKGNLKLVEIFIGIALVILALAILNYINLSLSRIMTRFKEIGLKKTIGATWKKLMYQILFESVLILTISLFLAILFSELASSIIASVYGKSIPISTYLSFPDALILFMIPIILGVIAGLYPAIVFSIYTPKRILSGLRMKYSHKNPFLHYLTTFQFTIAIILISSTFIMYLQINYVKHKDLGFNEELLLRTFAARDKNGNNDFYIDALRAHSGVKGITVSSSTPGIIGRHIVNNDSEGKMIAEISIDSNFLDVFDIELLSGRDLLTGDYDKVAYVNEKVLEVLDWDSIAGKTYEGREIIGVVEDFHTGSLYGDIEPVFLVYNQEGAYQITLKLDGNKLPETIAYLEQQWKKAEQSYPLRYEFYDDFFDAMYQKEERLSKVLTIFSSIAIIISCLGIIGMIEFTAIKKTKEIGIRKAIGAWSIDIVGMLLKSYFTIFLIAILIAVPIAWQISHIWLRTFTFRIELQWYHFVLTGGIIAFISLATISFQTLKAARRNPVDSLRYE